MIILTVTGTTLPLISTIVCNREFEEVFYRKSQPLIQSACTKRCQCEKCSKFYPNNICAHNGYLSYSKRKGLRQTTT